MSQEEQPFRTRRELREARERATVQGAAADSPTPDAQQREAGDASPEVPVTGGSQVPPVSEAAQAPSPNGQAAPATGRTRRVAEAPVDAEPVRAERSSQLRARDRAALRAIKELAEKEEQLSGGTPTRRQRRLQELALETRQRPVVPLPGQDGATPNEPGQHEPGSKDEPSDGRDRPGMGVSFGPVPGTAPVRVVSKSAGEPLPDDMSLEEALAERERFTAQAQEYFAKLAENPGADAGAVDQDVLAEQIAMAERAAILNQRAQRKEQLAREAENAKAAPKEPFAPATAHNLGAVSREEAVEVPGVAHPVIKAPTTQVQIPVPQRLPQKPAAAPSSPEAGQEPAPETVQVRRVPVAGQGPAEAEAEAEAETADTATDRPEAVPSAPVNHGKKGGKGRKPGRRAQLLAQAEALANAGDEPAGAVVPVAGAVPAQTQNLGQVFTPTVPVAAPVTVAEPGQRDVVSQAPPAPAAPPRNAPGAVAAESLPVAARDAHGLEPLDVGTAGVHLATRLRLLYWGVLVLGGVALVVGVILAISAGGR